MPKISSGENSAGNAPALRRAVQILDFVSELKTPPTFTDIVTSLGLPKVRYMVYVPPSWS